LKKPLKGKKSNLGTSTEKNWESLAAEKGKRKNGARERKPVLQRKKGKKPGAI